MVADLPDPLRWAGCVALSAAPCADGWVVFWSDSYGVEDWLPVASAAARWCWRPRSRMRARECHPHAQAPLCLLLLFSAITQQRLQRWRLVPARTYVHCSRQCPFGMFQNTQSGGRVSTNVASSYSSTISRGSCHVCDGSTSGQGRAYANRACVADCAGRVPSDPGFFRAGGDGVAVPLNDYIEREMGGQPA